MFSLHKKPDTEEKLRILSQDSQYDLACACGTKNPDDHRYRSDDNRWIYPVALPDGRTTFLFKTMVSNSCVNDCRYCPLRAGTDSRRCTLAGSEIVKVFLDYYNRGIVSGLFLTSGVTGNPDRTMEMINDAAAILRKREQFKGYMHLKIIPGASDAAVEEAVSLASAVSVNIEAPGESNFRVLTSGKDYISDVIRPLKLISRLTAKGERYSRVKQTTQFVVGASGETDVEIVKYTWGLYKRLNLQRVYFSAYQRGAGDADLPGEISPFTNEQMLTREHRLYQTDFLLRKYGFTENDILFDRKGHLDLDCDPKEVWAKNHPEFFPLNINRADPMELLRVPGMGHVTVDLIMKIRREGRIRSMHDLGRVGKRLGKAAGYIEFGV
ncbi:MAG TPA: radical SAM protein [Spirochaetota bacterium]|nr:radical SAM protein [Spirochaetota bacterium]HPJ35977.1 radical SAM protein [Spirochaetota bacterium]